jgi:antitoxin PrlF
MTMYRAKVTFKGQITIPREVREILEIKEGQSVLFVVEKDHAILKPLRKKSLLDFYGVLPATKPFPGMEALRKEIHKKMSKRMTKKG